MKRALEFFGAGVLVYGLAAACGAADEKDAHPPTNAAGGDGGSAGVGGHSGAGVDSAADALGDSMSVVDALTDPVREADAQQPTATVVTVACDVAVQYAGGNTVYFAEASFAGKSVEQLARLTAYTNHANPLASPVAPPGYRNQVVLPVIQPGKAAVACGSGSGSTLSKADSVTFVLP
jgi:hypothetical protein